MLNAIIDVQSKTKCVIILADTYIIYVRVLHYTRLERLASDKHSSILGPFMSYEENEVL